VLELPDKSPYVWQRFFAENQSLVFQYVVRKIEIGLRDNLPQVELIKFKNTAPTIVLAKDYLYMLQQALRIFIRDENYEYAQRTQQIVNDYCINQLLSSS
jgi:hypothetical protein